MAVDQTAQWLRGLAQDVIDHQCCDGCKYNAAQALEHLGLLDEVLALLNVEDPRHSQRRRGSDRHFRTGDGDQP